MLQTLVHEMVVSVNSTVPQVAQNVLTVTLNMPVLT